MDYWRHWKSAGEKDFGGLPPGLTECYRRSLLILRTQIDRGGAVIAANDTDISAVPYAERREWLEALGERLGAGGWVVPPRFDDGPATLETAREMCLEGVVAKRLWHWSPATVFFGVGLLLLVDAMFLASNATKLASGGWFPLLIGSAIFAMLMTWKRGRGELAARQAFPSATIVRPSAMFGPGDALFGTLADGRPPMGIACAQQDVAHIYPLPDDPEASLEDFLERAADHARRMAERLEAQERSVRRFLELNGEGLPEA